MYHRDQNPDWKPGDWAKTCPGLKVTHENLDADVLRSGTVTQPCRPSSPTACDGSDKAINNVVFHAASRVVDVSAGSLRRRQWATTDSCQTGESLRQGSTFRTPCWVEGENVDCETRLWVAEDGARVWMGGTAQKARYESCEPSSRAPTIMLRGSSRT